MPDQYISLPDGQVLSFPADMPDAEISGVIDAKIYNRHAIPPKAKSPEYLAMQAEQTALREKDEGGTTAKILGAAEAIVQPVAEFRKLPARVLEIPEQLAATIGSPTPYSSKAPLVAPKTMLKGVEALTPGGAASEGSFGQAAQEFVAETASGMTSPEMIGMIALGGKAPVPVGRYFQGEMLSHIPEAVKGVVEGETGKDKTKAALAVAADVVFPALIERNISKPAPPALVETARKVGPATEAAARTMASEVESRAATITAAPVERITELQAPKLAEAIEAAPDATTAPAGLTMPQSLPAPASVLVEPMRASVIIGDMADLVNRPIRIGHISGKPLGIFKPGAEVMRVKKANDLPVASHEVAHALERVHRRALGGIGRKDWTMQIPRDARRELQNLDYDPKKRRAYEGFAELTRHWLTIGDTATVAPRAHAWFESTFLAHNPEMARGLESIREKISIFRGQGSVARVQSMVEFDPPKTPLKQTVQTNLRKAQRMFVDDLADLERVEREIVGGDKLALGEASPSKVARMVTQSSGTRAREWARNAMTDFAGNRTGPSLKEVFGRTGIAGEEKAAVLFAVARRAQELHKRGIDPGISFADAGYTVGNLRTPAREQFAKEITAWNEGALKYLLDAGGISPETFKAITAQNESYIPFFRVWEAEAGSGMPTGGRRIGDTPQTIHRIKGSGREIRSPLETMQEHANQIIATADKTRVARSLVDLVESKEGFGKYVERIPADKMPTEFSLDRIRQQVEAAGGDLSAADLDAVMTLYSNSPRTPTGGNIVAFVRNGKRQFYELDPELYRSIQALDYQKLPALLDTIFGIPSRAVRLGATGIHAGFSLITNPIRDLGTLLLQSKGNPAEALGQWVQHMAKQIGLRESEVKDVWRGTGGELSQPLGMDRASLRKAVDDVLDNTTQQKALNVLKHPVETARQILSFTEAVPRLAEFEMTLREMGWKPGSPVSPDMAIEAANRAADVTVNFRRGGHVGRTLNQMIAFWNPAVQGLSKFARAHTESKVGAVSRGIGMMTIPALVNWWLNRDDEEWINLPPWLKYGFLNFKVADEWVRLPMPFDWFHLYGALPIAAADSLYRQKPEEMGTMFGQVLKTMTPPVLPSVAAPLIEAGMNESFYTGRPIVSASTERLSPTEQAKPQTTATARQVADILSIGGVEVSPAKIEHVLNGETGGFWGHLVHAVEVGTGIAPPTATLEPADIPIVGRLFIRDGSSALIDEFYTELEHLSAKQTTFKKLSGEGSERAAKYELSEGESARLRAMQRMQDSMTALRVQYRDSTTREERDRLWKEMEMLAKTALELD